MSNATITFIAKRALVSGTVALDDEISLHVTLTTFDPQANVRSDEITTLDGNTEASLYNITDSYSCQIIETGTVTLADTSTVALTPAYMECFFRSVAAREEFTITNPDSTLEMTCTMPPKWTPQRRSAADLDKFGYSFSVKEVV